MLLKYFYDKELAQASYMVGCAATGEALIVDAGRDIRPYLQAAQEEGLRITRVTETHIHADYVSGSRELAHATDATLFLSDEGDENWKYGFDDGRTVLVKNGDSWKVGNILVEVLHTPGHTPEHISFQITDTAGSDHPIGIFTGDFLFVGDVGRPDLLEEAAGIMDTAEPGARLQFKNIEAFKRMPDHLQIWPAHGAGSACGKALGAVPSTTLGYEKLTNPAFQFDEEGAFVAWLLSDQPEAPRYFAQMKHVNKVGPALLDTLPETQALAAGDAQAILDSGALVVDTRSREAFNAGHLPGALSIAADSGTFNTYVGWFVDYDEPLYLVADENAIESILRELRAVGIDNVPGYFTPEAVANYRETLPQITANDLLDRLNANDVRIIDVRGATEFRDGHIAGATNIPMGYLPRHLADLPRDTTIVTQCAGGVRSQVAASLLQRHGFEKVVNLTGGLDAWQAAKLPVES